MVIGTGRINNMSAVVAKYIARVLESKSVEVILVDPKDHLTSPITVRVGKETDGPSRWQDIAKSVDGFVVVLPEYNRSYPGELKLLIDQLYTEYKHKPFYPVGVSDGSTGGARAVEAFLHVIVGVEGIPIKSKLFFPMVDQMFDKDGSIKDKSYDEKVLRIVDAMTPLI